MTTEREGEPDPFEIPAFLHRKTVQDVAEHYGVGRDEAMRMIFERDYHGRALPRIRRRPVPEPAPVRVRTRSRA